MRLSRHGLPILRTRRQIWRAAARQIGYWDFVGICLALEKLIEREQISWAQYHREMARAKRHRPRYPYSMYWWSLSEAGDRARRRFCKRMETAR